MHMNIIHETFHHIWDVNTVEYACFDSTVSVANLEFRRDRLCLLNFIVCTKRFVSAKEIYVFAVEVLLFGKLGLWFLPTNTCVALKELQTNILRKQRGSLHP